MSRARCERCTRPQRHCLCPLIPSLPNRTRVLILQHSDEERHALNTARLAVLGLANAELQVGEVFADLQQWLNDYRAYLLFPGEEAQELPLASVPADGRPLLLVVPDGTWRKARKLIHLNPMLAELPRVCLPAGLQSRYRLRKAPGEGALATVEAITVALNLQEAPICFDELLRPFEALIEGQIAAMGEETFRRNHQKP